MLGWSLNVRRNQTKKHNHCLILVLSLHIKPQQINDNMIEDIDMPLQIRTLLHLQPIQLLLHVQLICQGLGHMLSLQFRPYFPRRRRAYNVIHDLTCQTQSYGRRNPLFQLLSICIVDASRFLFVWCLQKILLC